MPEAHRPAPQRARTDPTPGAPHDHTPEPVTFAVALSTDDVSARARPLRPAPCRRSCTGVRASRGSNPTTSTRSSPPGVALNGPNDIDEPRRARRAARAAPGVGRAGPGSRARVTVATGAPGSPSTRSLLDGEPLAGHHVGGPGLLEVHATDAARRASRCAWTIELEPSGLVRCAPRVTNTGTSPFTVDAVALAMPLPAGLDELLDFGGRWGTERVPQRAAAAHRHPPA